MALRYAILGYLSTGSGSGYDLAQQLDGGLGWFWSASHSQIYPELKRLEEDGLIEGESTTVGERLEKRVYAITEKGVEALVAWTAQPPVYRPNRDPERLQLIFADLGDLAAIRGHLEAHRARYAERRDSLTRVLSSIVDRRHRRVEMRLSGRPPDRQALTLLLRELAYRGDIERAEGEVRWATSALEQLDEHERAFADRQTRSSGGAAPAGAGPVAPTKPRRR
jgi:DNA-binding PadR family transcriptional regulator